ERRVVDGAVSQVGEPVPDDAGGEAGGSVAELAVVHGNRAWGRGSGLAGVFVRSGKSIKYLKFKISGCNKKDRRDRVPVDVPASRGSIHASVFILLQDARHLAAVVDGRGGGEAGAALVQDAEPAALLDEAVRADLRSAGAVDHADDDPLVVDRHGLGTGVALGLGQPAEAAGSRPGDGVGRAIAGVLQADHGARVVDGPRDQRRWA